MVFSLLPSGDFSSRAVFCDSCTQISPKADPQSSGAILAVAISIILAYKLTLPGNAIEGKKNP
jgi:hypothetical protein